MESRERRKGENMAESIHDTEENKTGEEAGMQDSFAREGISKVGVAMAFCTLIYWFVPTLIVNAVSLIPKLEGWPMPTNGTMYWVRFLSMYLVTMPLMVLILSKLPGSTPDRNKLKGKQYIGLVAATFGIMIVCNLIGVVIAAIVGSVTGVQIQDTSTLELITELDISAAVIFVSIVGPIFEELIFRKMLVTRLLRYGEGVAAVLSGLMFGIFHGNWNQFVYAFGLGVFLAIVFIWTGNVWVTISLHVLVNFSSSVLLGSLMKWAHYDQLMKVVLGAQSGDMTAAVAFMTENLTAVLCLYGYIFLEYALAITGIILVLVFAKQIKLNARDYAADKKKKAGVMFLNFGMIAFFILWAVNAVLELMGV